MSLSLTTHMMLIQAVLTRQINFKSRFALRSLNSQTYGESTRGGPRCFFCYWGWGQFDVWGADKFWSNRVKVKGEASPCIYACRLGEWRMILETQQQRFGQIWIIQSRLLWFFKGFINFVYVALSGGTLLISVMSQQYNCLMELYTQILLNVYFSWKCILKVPLLLYLGMLGLRWMCMHLLMNLIKRTIDIQEKLKIVKKIYTCTKSMESCPLVISHYSGRVPSREGDKHNFA